MTVLVPLFFLALCFYFCFSAVVAFRLGEYLFAVPLTICAVLAAIAAVRDLRLSGVLT